ncbi:MAG: hypothetical protein F4W92_06425 [Gammaproteobacteria bacterium]|nr:hypothetical protein [Gammaproteobacteria bacterium]
MKQDSTGLTPTKHRGLHFIVGTLIGILVGVAVYFAALSIFFQHGEEGEALGVFTVADDKRNQDSANSSRGDDFGRDENSNLNTHEFLDLIDGWSHEKLIQMIDQATTAPISNASVETNELLIGELARTNPQQALNKVWSFPSTIWYDLLPIVFQEWSASNLAEALTAAGNLVGTLQESAMGAILNSQDNLNDAKFVNLSRTLSIHALTQRMIIGKEAKELLDRPMEAWNLLMAKGAVNDEYWDVLVETAKSWVQQEGFVVLDRLIKDLYDRNNFTLTHVLQAIADDAPQQAFDWVLSTSADVQGKTAATIAQPWAQQDPKAALDATAGLDRRLNRRWTIQIITATWAKTNPQELVQHIAILPKNNRSLATSDALVALVQLDPQEALKSLQQLRTVPRAIDDNTETELVRSWSKSDPIAAMEWVRTNKEEDSREYAYMIQDIARAYALIDPEKAFTFARGEAPNSYFLSSTYLETEVLDSLARRGEVEVALKLLDRVREEAKLQAVQTVADNLIWVNRIEDVLTLSQGLTEDQQVDYFKSIAFRWMLDSPTSLVDNLPNLPSHRVRQEMVREILALAERFTRYLTSAQIDAVRAFLDDENSVNSSN